jgi:outer membrane murein-binding lipoprotein Lpp
MISSQEMRSVFFILIGLLLAVPVYAEKFDDLAQSLIRLRGDVEELQSQLDMEKQDHKGKMDSLSSQMSDLSVENHRQKIALEKNGSGR